MQHVFSTRGRLARFTALLALVTFVIAICPTAELSAQQKVRLPAGTAVSLKTNSTLIPNALNVGDAVALTVLNDVVIDGHTVIVAGATARGLITVSKDRGMIGIAAELGLTISSVEAVDGSTIALHGAKIVQGKSKMALSIGLSLICCILFGLMKGGDAQIPAGTQIQTEVAGTVEIEV